MKFFDKLVSRRGATQLLLLSIFSISTITARASLSGTYTIDASAAASSTNYKTFASAVSDLVSGTRADGGTANGAGVSGAVTFNVANGTYNEQITIASITGASSTNTVTFQSSSGDSSKVILTFASTSTNNYVVQLNGADFITFKKISIFSTSTATANARVIELKVNANFNTFTGCYIKGLKTTSSTSTGMALIYSPTDKDTNNSFIGNYIRYGSYAFYWLGSSTNRESGLLIKNNIIDSSYYTHIYTEYQVAPQIIGNTSTGVGNNSAHGVQLVSVTGAAMILKNKFDHGGTAGFYPIYINTGNASATARALIANNYVKVSGTSTSIAGIHLSNAQYYDVFYNTVLITNTATSSRAILIAASSSTTVRGYNRVLNNIFVNTGGFIAVDVNANAVTTKQLDTMDNNDIYATGANIARWSSTSYATLSAWQAASKQDPKSVSANPNFVSTSNLHINSSDVNLDGKAISVSSVTDDYDGETRNATTPDIGADEFTPPSNEAGITQLTSPAAGTCSGTVDVKIRVVNSGGNKIDSVRITYQLNGTTQNTTLYNLSLNTGKDTIIKVGTVTLSSTASAIKIFVVKVNGSNDPNHANDTLVSSSKAALTGSYTIGSGKNYTSFAAAASDLSSRGICGVVNFKADNGTYTEQVVLPAIGGSSASNTVTFESSSGDSSKVILQFASSSTNNYVVLLNGADYVTFKKITIKTTSTTSSNSRVVELASGAHYNTFTGCYLQGLKTTGTSNTAAIIFSSATDKDSNNIYTGNYFRYGSNAIALVGSTTIKERGLQIKNNIIDSAYSTQLNLDNQIAPLVQGNTLSGVGSSSAHGILLSNVTENATVTQNRISYGGTAGFYCIYINTGTATSAKRGLIANNFVTLAGTSTLMAGIHLSNAQYFDVLYNNVNVTNTASDSRAILVAASATTTPKGFNRIQNNIFVNTGGGVAYEVNANAISTTARQIDTSDNNDIYVTGTSIGKWGSTSYTNLAAWRTASGQDPKSLSVNPKFTSTTDLHVSYVLLDGAAKPFTSVTTDIDGQTRNATTPDIGADEFTPPPTDAGVSGLDYPTSALCAGTYDIKARIKNYGGSKIDSVTVTLLVDGVLQSVTKYRFSLDIDKDTSLKIGTITLGSTAQTLKIYTSKPNDITDGGKSNDTLVVKVQAGMTGTYTIGSGKNYANFTAAVNDLIFRGLCGATTFKVDDGTYNEQVSIPAITGSSASNTITFESASGDSSKAILSFASSTTTTNNYALQLNGADYVTFRKLTIQRTGTNTNAIVAEVKNGSHWNAITNSRLIGVFASSNSTAMAIISSTTDKDTNNTFSNNYIKDGSVPIVWTASSTTYETNNKFTGNIIDGGYEDATRISYQDKLTFSNNAVSGSRATTGWGVRIENGRNGGSISNNKIFNSAGAYGLYLSSNTATSASPMMVTNNMISVTSSSPTAAIYDNVNSYYYFYHNTALITSTSTSAKVFYVNAASTSPKGFQRIFNNVMANTGGGLVAEISTDAANTEQVDTADFNNIWTTGSNLIKLGTTNFTSLSSWQSYANQEPSSVSFNPRFFSNTDLHVRGVAMDNKGFFLSSVTTDIDGQTRSTSKPDIGADEYTAPVKDLSIVTILSPATGAASCGNSSTPVKVVLRNEGSADQSGFTIYANITGGVNTTLSQTYSKTLGSLKNDTFTFTNTLNTLSGGTVNVVAYTALSGEEYKPNDSAKVSVGINPVPVSKFSPSVTTICPKEKVSFTNQSTVASGVISSYAWDFGDGSSSNAFEPDKVYLAGGTYTVKLTVTSDKGCSHSSNMNITVNPAMKPAFTASSKVCTDVPIALTNTSSIASGKITAYSWDFGDGTTSTDSLPTKIYKTVGTYNIRLITTSDKGCRDTMIQSQVAVVGRPKAGFTATTVCGENLTQFTNTSITSGGIIYEWFFGDGNTSSDKNATHVYAKGGQYTVRLRLTNSNGCRDSVSQTVTVNPKPIAAFSTSRACAGDPVTFTDETSVNTGSIQTYQWSFGDGKSSADQNPVHTFATQGSFNVTLIAISDKGCSDTVTQKITVYSVPQIGFSANNVCVGNATQFTNQFVSASYKYVWDFGDGDSSEAVSPAHSYSAGGAYTVTLLVTNSNGCTRTMSKSVTVYDKPVADFSAGDVCLGSEMAFTDKSVFANGTAASWAWSFGDNETSTAQNPAHKYAAPGIYTVTLAVTNSNGCQDVFSKAVIINPMPKAGFQHTEVCLGQPTKFSNLSSIETGSIVNYYWQFGPNPSDTSSAQNPEFTFAEAGSHNVTLTVVSDKGCSATITSPATVYALPNVTFTKSRTHRTVTFTVNDTSYAKYEWDFGDAATSTQKHPAHYYTDNGTYTITLKVTSVHGCETVVKDTLKVDAVGFGEEKENAFRLNVYPNPFTNATTLEYELNKTSHVQAVLYDMQGRKLGTLIENAMQVSGRHTCTIDAAKMKMVSGTYLVRLVVDDKVVTKRVIRVE
jgi:PKD repeat protein